ncbi:MAG: excinuclease ABC subunit UvrB [Deltaproteobacteria bacterium]|jgi:excinuclease ABC subunit B|nr:excinuclease ABC subunit UvrB [Deltaproteobacteria bacterium]
MSGFQLHQPYAPAGDQPEAIRQLVEGLQRGDPHQVLLGATGTGKTFTIANVVAAVNRPTLLLCHNKILAAQLFGELRRFFPNNAVEYFVSYFDYYQPEAYVAATDTYIQKDSLINERIDKLRHAATRSLLTRRDVIIVASVSCIYGIGSREAYDDMLLRLSVGQQIDRKDILRKLVEILFERNEADFHRGTFRSRGDVIEVFPAHEDEVAVRIELFGDEVERICTFDALRGTRLEDLRQIAIFPASHYVTPKEQLEAAVRGIQVELQERLTELRERSWLLEAQRLEERTLFDIEMIEQTGRCKGIENYSRHLSGRQTGLPPSTLIEFFPSDWLLVVDESHVTMPQVGGMFKGDRARKEVLVRHGFRLPSALDNRPLQLHEFEATVGQAIYVSATPAAYELQQAGGVVVEQIIRPTGLLDPVVEVRPASTQVDDLLARAREAITAGDRVLVTVLTKRMAQELSDYLRELGMKVRYLHADIDTLERVEIVRQLRLGEIDILVGINLLREGLDIPEVALVAVLDADREGFLRNATSLIQTIGRAARNVNGRVILYGDSVTPSMAAAIEETSRRRAVQEAYNTAHGITPETIKRAIESPLADLLDGERVLARLDRPTIGALPGDETPDPGTVANSIQRLQREMQQAAKKLEFERAAELRDRVRQLQTWAVENGVTL